MSKVFDSNNLDVILDVKVEMTVQLGSCVLPMRQIVELTSGTVIQLKQQAKDPVALMVNGKLVAYAEVVVVDDNFGVKITELIGKEEEK